MSTLQKLGQLFSKKVLRLTAGVAAGSMMLGLGAFAESAGAVSIAGYEIGEKAFADQVLEYYGDYNTSGGTVESVLTDQDLATFAFSLTDGAFVRLGFSNNVINGSGDDLVLFDLGSLDKFEVTINSITKLVDTVATTYFATPGVAASRVNVANLNLDDFGINAGGLISEIKIGLDTTSGTRQTVPSLALVGSLSKSVPEPSVMFGLLATAGFLVGQRKLKLAKKSLNSL